MLGPRPFEFPADTFAFANELKWEYAFDEKGKWTSHRREPPPDYALRCFVLARSAKQFFQNARFEPRLPVVNETQYSRLARRVVRMSPRKPPRECEKVVIPGYASLYDFSAAHPGVLKTECGGAWVSYFQRGHWRMIFPFSSRHRERTASELKRLLKRGWPVVVHVSRFPSLAINHALLLYDYRESGEEVTFSAYDPNEPGKSVCLEFDVAERIFKLPRMRYFYGGRVDVYPVYHHWAY